jgi:hypothetical protein
MTEENEIPEVPEEPTGEPSGDKPAFVNRPKPFERVIQVEKLIELDRGLVSTLVKAKRDMNMQEIRAQKPFRLDNVRVDLSAMKRNYEMQEGVYTVFIKDVLVEFKHYMTEHPYCGSGTAITWVYETFGCPNPLDNRRTIYHSTPVDGAKSIWTDKVLDCVLPDRDTRSQFNPKDVIAKALEVEVKYFWNKYTARLRRFPSVVKVYPLIESIGTLEELLNDESFLDDEGG